MSLSSASLLKAFECSHFFLFRFLSLKDIYVGMRERIGNISPPVVGLTGGVQFREGFPFQLSGKCTEHYYVISCVSRGSKIRNWNVRWICIILNFMLTCSTKNCESSKGNFERRQQKVYFKGKAIKANVSGYSVVFPCFLTFIAHCRSLTILVHIELIFSTADVFSLKLFFIANFYFHRWSARSF